MLRVLGEIAAGHDETCLSADSLFHQESGRPAVGPRVESPAIGQSRTSRRPVVGQPFRSAGTPKPSAGSRVTAQGCASLRDCHADAHTVRLRPGAVWVDALELEALADSADFGDLQRAMELFRGAFLAGLNIKEELFESWLQQQRRASRPSGRTRSRGLRLAPTHWAGAGMRSPQPNDCWISTPCAKTGNASRLNSTPAIAAAMKLSRGPRHLPAFCGGSCRWSRKRRRDSWSSRSDRVRRRAPPPRSTGGRRHRMPHRSRLQICLPDLSRWLRRKLLRGDCNGWMSPRRRRPGSSSNPGCSPGCELGRRSGFSARKVAAAVAGAAAMAGLVFLVMIPQFPAPAPDVSVLSMQGPVPASGPPPSITVPDAKTARFEKGAVAMIVLPFTSNEAPAMGKTATHRRAIASLITDELTTTLSSAGAIRVISRETARTSTAGPWMPPGWAPSSVSPICSRAALRCAAIICG